MILTFFARNGNIFQSGWVCLRLPTFRIVLKRLKCQSMPPEVPRVREMRWRPGMFSRTRWELSALRHTASWWGEADSSPSKPTFGLTTSALRSSLDIHFVKEVFFHTHLGQKLRPYFEESNRSTRNGNQNGPCSKHTKP